MNCVHFLFVLLSEDWWIVPSTKIMILIIVFAWNCYIVLFAILFIRCDKQFAVARYWLPANSLVK